MDEKKCNEHCAYGTRLDRLEVDVAELMKAHRSQVVVLSVIGAVTTMASAAMSCIGVLLTSYFKAKGIM